MSVTLSPTLSLKGEGVIPSTGNSLPLQGEGQGGGKKGGVTRNAKAHTKKNAKSLRRNMTDAEQQLWYHLRAQRFSDYKFRRQHPISHYIVDFVCLKSGLIIELDGGQHGEKYLYDQKRSQFLESKGFRIVRFWNNEMLDNKVAVLENILKYLTHRPLNSLPLQGEDQGEGVL